MGRFAVVVFVLAACTRTSEKYCGLHPEDLANCPRSDAAIDARPACSDDLDCSASAPRCFLPGAGPGVCVGCLTTADCTQGGLCDPETLACRSCIVHADCPSRACLPDGTCGTDDNTIFVGGANADDTGTCTAAAPCATIEFGLTHLDPMTRYHVKLSGELAGPVLISDKRAVLVSDPGTVIAGGDPALKLQSSTITIHDLRITGVNCLRIESGSTVFLHGVLVSDCSKQGIEVKNGFFSMTRSRVTTSAEGGIWLLADVTFEITNSIIDNNGHDNSPRGGVTLDALMTGNSNRFEHNTVVANQTKAAATTAGGVTCTATNFRALPNNILAGNLGTHSNHVGGCIVTESLRVDGDLAPLAFTADYHIGETSIAKDQVESTIADDFDGHFRPQGTKKDFGADEYRP